MQNLLIRGSRGGDVRSGGLELRDVRVALIVRPI